MNTNENSLYSLKYYNGHYGFYKIFEEYNINLISQIFDDNLMEEIFCKLFKPYNYELLGFIDLVKYSYNNIPLRMNQLLDQNYKLIINNEINLSRMGFNRRQINNLIYTIEKAKKDFQEDTTLIECFKLLLTKYNKILNNGIAGIGVDVIIKKYLESYEFENLSSHKRK